MKTKTKPLRCKHCKKKQTLIDISNEPERINPRTIRSYTGIQCQSCGWSEKSYAFTDAQEE